MCPPLRNNFDVTCDEKKILKKNVNIDLDNSNAVRIQR